MAVQLNKMLEKFGIVTVMDVKIYDFVGNDKGEWDAIRTLNKYNTGEEEWEAIEPIANLDSLKIVNINQDGPGKTATGGISADTLIKFGKAFTVEIQDALGSFAVMENLFGGQAYKSTGDKVVLALTDRFAGPKTLVGKTFYVDQETGAKQPLVIALPKFLPDTVFNLQHDAEGDVSVFDINGSLMAFKDYGEGEVYKVADPDVTLNDPRIGRYRPGSDNEFYFISTLEAFDSIVDPEVTGAGDILEGYPDIEIEQLDEE